MSRISVLGGESGERQEMDRETFPCHAEQRI